MLVHKTWILKIMICHWVIKIFLFKIVIYRSSKTTLTNKFMYRNQVLIESKNIEPQFILINFESTEDSYIGKKMSNFCAAIVWNFMIQYTKTYWHTCLRYREHFPCETLSTQTGFNYNFLWYMYYYKIHLVGIIIYTKSISVWLILL